MDGVIHCRTTPGEGGVAEPARWHPARIGRLDHQRRADRAAAHRLAQGDGGRAEAHREGDLQLDVVRAAGGDHRLAIGARRRQRLLAEDVLPRFSGGDDHLAVARILRADDHGGDVVAREEVVIGGIVDRGKSLGILTPTRLVVIRDGDQFDAGNLPQACRVARRVALVREADHPDPQWLHRQLLLAQGHST
jgi:hypothetical protein